MSQPVYQPFPCIIVRDVSTSLTQTVWISSITMATLYGNQQALKRSFPVPQCFNLYINFFHQLWNCRIQTILQASTYIVPKTYGSQHCSRQRNKLAITFILTPTVRQRGHKTLHMLKSTTPSPLLRLLCTLLTKFNPRSLLLLIALSSVGVA
jgi:hypothetical protein